MRKILFAIQFLVTASFAQVPPPGDSQSEAILLLNGIAHLGNGKVIESSAIGFEKGKLTYVGSSSDLIDKSKYKVTDIAGKHVYPGFILPSTDLGLNEVAAVRSTQDKAETGSLKPNVRSIIAYNTDSEIIPTLRFNGILTAQIAPKGGMIAGTSSIVHLDAWNWEDALIEEDDAIHLFWPRKRIFQTTAKPEEVAKSTEQYESAIQLLSNLFQASKSYSEAKRKKINLKLEAMKGLFDGSKQLFVNATKAKDIIRAIEFAKGYGVKKIVLVDATEVYHVKEYIKENSIPVILNDVHGLPSRADSDVDEAFKLPYQLYQEDILFCLGYSNSVMSTRNLPFYAGTSVAYGMDKEEALKTITLNTAKILRIDDQIGSIEVGKQATFFVSEGDALDMRTNKLSMAFIQGRRVTLEAMQQQLYKKYKTKYGQ